MIKKLGFAERRKIEDVSQELDLAWQGCDPEALIDIFRNGGNINDTANDAIFFCAASDDWWDTDPEGGEEFIRTWVSLGGAINGIFYDNGRNATLLEHAIKNTLSAEHVSRLISCGANPNIWGNHEELGGPIFQAIDQADSDLVDVLIKAKVDLKVLSGEGLSPLEHLARCSIEPQAAGEIFASLIKAKQEPTSDALLESVLNGNRVVLEELLKTGRFDTEEISAIIDEIKGTPRDKDDVSDNGDQECLSYLQAQLMSIKSTGGMLTGKKKKSRAP